MKKEIMTIFALLALLLAGCHQETLEERTLRESQEYTRRHCPEDQGSNAILDSVVFDVESRTLIHYYRLTNESDNEERAKEKKAELDDKMIDATRKNMQYKRYKDAGFSFRYIASSDSSGRVIYDKTITKDDYGY